MSSNTQNIVEDLFNEAKNGKVFIGDPSKNFKFYTKFYANETNYVQPYTELIYDKNSNSSDYSTYATINIPNKQEFLDKLDDYIFVARDFYKDDQSYWMLEDDDDAFNKKLILDLLLNVTPTDCHNINQFITTRTRMLQSNVKANLLHLGEYNGLQIKAKIEKTRSNLEAPYKFTTFLIDSNNNKFILPTVLFGVVDNTVYLYAIQNFAKRQDNPLAKKLDRYFRKVNKGIDLSTNIAQISPNALVSLTIFLEHAQNMGKTNVVAPSYMPIRYHGNKVAGYRRLKTSSQKHSWQLEHDRNQYNITNKMINLLFRYQNHFSDSTCDFDDITLNTYLKLDSTIPQTTNDNIIFDISRAVKNQKDIQPTLYS